jgi:hypothetical protein
MGGRLRFKLIPPSVFMYLFIYEVLTWADWNLRSSYLNLLSAGITGVATMPSLSLCSTTGWLPVSLWEFPALAPTFQTPCRWPLLPLALPPWDNFPSCPPDSGS